MKIFFRFILLTLISNPLNAQKISSEKLVENILTKNNILLQNNYTVNADDFVSIYDFLYKYKDFYEMPQIIVFDSIGQFIKHKEHKICHAGDEFFLSKLSLDTTYCVSNITTLDSVLEKLRTFNGDKIPEISKSNFYVFCFWKVNSASIFYKRIRKLEKLASNYKNVKVTFIKINLDYQENWGFDKIKEIKASF